MTPAQAGVVARTEMEISEAFGHYGLPEPDTKAKNLIKHLLDRGWRPYPQLVDRPGPGGRGPSEVARQALAEARATVEAKRGSRPELPPSCGAEHHPDDAATVYCRQPAGHGGQHHSVDGQDAWS